VNHCHMAAVAGFAGHGSVSGPCLNVDWSKRCLSREMDKLGGITVNIVFVSDMKVKMNLMLSSFQ